VYQYQSKNFGDLNNRRGSLECWATYSISSSAHQAKTRASRPIKRKGKNVLNPSPSHQHASDWRHRVVSSAVDSVPDGTFGHNRPCSILPPFICMQVTGNAMWYSNVKTCSSRHIVLQAIVLVTDVLTVTNGRVQSFHHFISMQVTGDPDLYSKLQTSSICAYRHKMVVLDPSAISSACKRLETLYHILNYRLVPDVLTITNDPAQPIAIPSTCKRLGGHRVASKR
jgi:hypothetical protein